MAVQKSRVTPSRRGQRRSHDALTAKQLSTDPTSGEIHLRHHITAEQYEQADLFQNRGHG
ncbi:50S ribosomal protein L32 [Xanthomonas vasicola]|uniref:50S ribosomal protein L32 n=1 Tax=Xanthomonas vasicola TaxID=56459 RepID=UPI0011AD89E1|nr:50S ribosomal protein L32 [Xanthomonas vasicola]TWQ73583.1 50S ribosomal protein L32 [Xanthomonas vasicola]